MISTYKKNIVYNSLYRAVMILTPLITSPYISRVLGAEKIGIYTYCYAYATYFVVCSMLGVQDYGNRTIAKNRDSKETLSQKFWQIYYLQAFLTLIATYIYIVTILSLNSSDISIRLIMIIYVATGITSVEWFAFGCEEFRFTSIRSIIVRVVIVISIFCFVKNENDIEKYTVILILGNLMSTVPIWTLVRKKTTFVKPNFKEMLKHVKPNFLLFLPVMATTVYQQMDKLMLGNASMSSEVGYYQNAENIVTLPTFLTSAIVTVMLPYISNMISKDKEEESIELMKKTLHYSSILNIAMAFGVFSISDVFIPWFLGEGYERSATLVRIISPIIVIGGISSVVRYEYLIPKEKDKTFTISIILGAIVNVILNAVLIPNYKANGAAIATVVAYSIVLIYQMLFSYKDVKYFTFFVKQIPYIIVGLIMYLLISCVNNVLHASNLLTVLIDLLCGIFIYGVGIILIMTMTEDELITMIKKKF